MQNVVITLKEEIKLSGEDSMDSQILLNRVRQKMKDTIGNITERIDVDYLANRLATDNALKEMVNGVIEKGLAGLNNNNINTILESKGFNYRYAGFDIIRFDEVSSEQMELKVIFHSSPITVLETFTLTGKQAYLCAEGDISADKYRKIENLTCLEFSPYKILTYQQLHP